MSDTTRPAARVDLHPVSVAIWKNLSVEGIFYSATLERRFRDTEGKWKNSGGINERDLLLAAKALDMAHTEILRLRGAAEHSDEDAA